MGLCSEKMGKVGGLRGREGGGRGVRLVGKAQQSSPVPFPPPPPPECALHNEVFENILHFPRLQYNAGEKEMEEKAMKEKEMEEMEEEEKQKEEDKAVACLIRLRVASTITFKAPSSFSFAPKKH